MITIGVEAYCPLVTKYEEALNGSRVGVYIDGLWSLPIWLKTMVCGLGSVKFS